MCPRRSLTKSVAYRHCVTLIMCLLIIDIPVRHHLLEFTKCLLFLFLCLYLCDAFLCLLSSLPLSCHLFSPFLSLSSLSYLSLPRIIVPYCLNAAFFPLCFIPYLFSFLFPASLSSVFSRLSSLAIFLASTPPPSDL